MIAFPQFIVSIVRAYQAGAYTTPLMASKDLTDPTTVTPLQIHDALLQVNDPAGTVVGVGPAESNPLPDGLDPKVCERGIPAHEPHCLRYALCCKHSIERIAMLNVPGSSSHSMCRRDRQLDKARLP